MKYDYLTTSVIEIILKPYVTEGNLLLQTLDGKESKSLTKTDQLNNE